MESDGTIVNTGHLAGVIRLYEEMFDCPVQWLICLLHCNELPFRHLFVKLDGVTSGPNDLFGPIGRQLHHCETLLIVRFNRIPFILPNVDVETLSSDKRILLQ